MNTGFPRRFSDVAGPQVVHPVEGDLAVLPDDAYQVHHALYSLHGHSYGGCIGDVAVLDLNPFAMEQVLPSGAVRQGTDPFPMCHKGVDHPPAHESGGARNENQPTVPCLPRFRSML